MKRPCEIHNYRREYNLVWQHGSGEAPEVLHGCIAQETNLALGYLRHNYQKAMSGNPSDRFLAAITRDGVAALAGTLRQVLNYADRRMAKNYDYLQIFRSKLASYIQDFQQGIIELDQQYGVKYSVFEVFPLWLESKYHYAGPVSQALCYQTIWADGFQLNIISYGIKRRDEPYYVAPEQCWKVIVKENPDVERYLNSEWNFTQWIEYRNSYSLPPELKYASNEYFEPVGFDQLIAPFKKCLALDEYSTHRKFEKSLDCLWHDLFETYMEALSEAKAALERFPTDPKEQLATMDAEEIIALQEAKIAYIQARLNMRALMRDYTAHLKTAKEVARWPYLIEEESKLKFLSFGHSLTYGCVAHELRYDYDKSVEYRETANPNNQRLTSVYLGFQQDYSGIRLNFDGRGRYLSCQLFQWAKTEDQTELDIKSQLEAFILSPDYYPNNLQDGETALVHELNELAALHLPR